MKNPKGFLEAYVCVLHLKLEAFIAKRGRCELLLDRDDERVVELCLEWIEVSWQFEQSLRDEIARVECLLTGN